MIKLAISGCQGKMGQRLINLAKLDKGFKIVALLEMVSHPDIGVKVDSIAIANISEDIKKADVLIEFTSPEATLEHLSDCLKYKKPMVIGTTGLTVEQLKEIKSVSKKIPVVFSPNMSLGVNLLFRLVREAATKLSKEYNVNITEAHHVHKKDAPSGTAKKLAEIINEVGNQEIADMKSIREGEVVGDHEVCFESSQDIIRLYHSAKTRDIFAQGALEAAKFIARKRKGLFDMQDVLNSKAAK